MSVVAACWFASWALALGLLVAGAVYFDGLPGRSPPCRRRRQASILGVLLIVLLGGLVATGMPLLGGFPRTGILNSASAAPR